MSRRNAMSPAERRAMADALRHMHGAGVRRVDIRQASQLSPKRVHRAISFVILPRRDGIGSPTGAVSPRQPGLLDGGLPVDLAGDSGAVPALFQGGSVDGNSVGQGSAWAVVGKSVHGTDVAPCGPDRHPVSAAGFTA